MSQQQSPIDLVDPILTDYGRDALKIRWSEKLQGTIDPKQHKVLFNCVQPEYISLEGSEYQIVEFHFHFPSEHWVKGVQQEIELHVVHQNAQTGDRVVLGVFIDSKTKIRGKMTSVLDTKAYKSLDDEEEAGNIPTNPWDWMPGDRSRYYRYEGSLTTPRYDENVHWIIFPERLQIDHDLYLRVIKCYGKPARIPQPRCRRFLLANFKP